MDKIVDATFDGEVFRPDGPVDLAPNTRVKLRLQVKEKKKTGKPYAFIDLALGANLDLPPDYASNIDEYLYGGKSLDND